MMFGILWIALKLLWFVVRMLVRVALLVLEGAIWFGWFLWHMVTKTSDAAEAAASVHEGQLRCPRGHAVPLSGGIYQCAECGYVYEGSILQCGNPECGATTPYVNCPECGLSARNPYRCGRP